MSKAIEELDEILASKTPKEARLHMIEKQLSDFITMKHNQEYMALKGTNYKDSSLDARMQSEISNSNNEIVELSSILLAVNEEIKLNG